MSNDEREQVIATVTSGTAREALETKTTHMLNQLAQRLSMPYGMRLQGRVTSDRYGNLSLYVFLLVRDQGSVRTFPGRSGIGNEGPRIDEVKGGRWINLNRDDFNPDWEARELKLAIENYLKTTTTAR